MLDIDNPDRRLKELQSQNLLTLILEIKPDQNQYEKEKFKK